MTHAEVKEVAEEAAEMAVAKVLKSLGIDVTDTKSIEKFQENMRHLNTWREASELVKRQTLKTAVGVIVTGLLGYIVLAFQRHP